MDGYIDNNNRTITDSKTGLIWSKEDSWQMENKWLTWDEAMEFPNHLNDLALGGKKNWRLPNIEEAKSLYDPDKVNQDKYGKEVHVNPVFPDGFLSSIWIFEPATGSEAYFLDLSTGKVDLKFKSVAGRMAARPVSKEE